LSGHLHGIQHLTDDDQVVRTYLYAADELADDPRHVAVHLGHGAAGEERGVVVVAAELAHHEQ
jgi:hypothetical protein